jgi:hypothetical protein
MPVSQVPFAGISNPVDFRNIVINGDMQIAQRATSVASLTTSGYYTLDRFKFFNTSLGTFTMSQSTDVPSGYGFANSLKLDCTTADASPAASDNLRIQQIFEGQNLQYLKKGTANASPLTASFWVKSTKTGTFICELVDLDNSRSVSKSYTVSVTNTWEFKTVTFPGDTTGAFTNDNGDSLSLNFWLGAGSDFTSGTLATTWVSTTNANRAVGQVNIADSTANDWLITGVQLEAGEQASGFEFMPYDVNLNRCQRYAQKVPFAATGAFSTIAEGFCDTTTAAFMNIIQTVTMRTTPSVTQTGNLRIHVAGSATSVTSIAIDSNIASQSCTTVVANVASGLTVGQGCTLEQNNSTTANLLLSAEL